MGFTNIKAKNQGFTIVELLIVVVVIAILAAITIVSYNGITNRANASAAKSLVATWQKKIELYQAETSTYPYAASQLNSSSKSYHITGSSLNGTTALTSETGKTKVQIRACASGSTAPASDADVARIDIVSWDYEASPATTKTTVIGTGTGTGCTAYWAAS